MSPSNEYFAAAGGENLFTQPQNNVLPPQAAKDFLHNTKDYFSGPRDRLYEILSGFLNIPSESHVLFWMLIFEPSGLVERKKMRLSGAMTLDHLFTWSITTCI